MALSLYTCCALTPDEVREVTGMVQRIAAMLLLRVPLDANYQMVNAAAML